MSSATASSLQRKLRKAVEPQPDSPDVTAALRELSAFFGDNTPGARRSLRSTIERRGVELNHGLLTAFDKLQSQLDTIDREVGGLSDACTAISTQLARSRASTEVMLSQTARLREEVALTEQRSAAADAFIGCFGLSAEDEAVLNAPTAVELEPLLAALQRVQQIHERAKALLDGPHQQLGLHLLESMAAHEERAYASICAPPRHPATPPQRRSARRASPSRAAPRVAPQPCAPLGLGRSISVDRAARLPTTAAVVRSRRRPGGASADRWVHSQSARLQPDSAASVALLHKG
eukprot:4942116-Prymnesium_polylepis.1